MPITKRRLFRTNPAPLFVLDGVFTPEECEAWAERAEQVGYTKAMIDAGYGKHEVDLEIRNNDRAIVIDEAMADDLFQRIKAHLPDPPAGAVHTRMNPYLRFLRYDPGQYFRQHKDGMFRDGTEFSVLTVQLYLNDGFDGGDTVFFDPVEDRYIYAVPKQGSVLIFDQSEWLHEGDTLLTGQKLCVRTEVMCADGAQDDDDDDMGEEC